MMLHEWLSTVIRKMHPGADVLLRMRVLIGLCKWLLEFMF